MADNYPAPTEISPGVLEHITTTGQRLPPPGDNTQGVAFSKDYNLISLTILSNNTVTIDLKSLLIQLSYYEDIFSNFISGELLVTDALGTIAELNLHGNEYIRVVFNKHNQGNSLDSTIDKLFRIYKISSRQKTFNFDSEVYCLHFCSDEVLLSEQKKISKSYKGKNITEIIEDILTNYLLIGDNSKNKDIGEVTDAYDLIIPNLKVFEAINWLSNFAKTNRDGGGADWLFYENNKGYHFKSLQELFKQNVSTDSVFRYDPKNIPSSFYNTDDDRDIFNVLSYEFLDSFDTIEGVASGMFANRLISFDPILRRYINTDFNYSDYTKTAKTLNKYPIVNNMINRDKNTLYETPEACLKLSATNRDQRKVPYIKDKLSLSESAVPHDFNIETYLSKRKAQLSLSNYHRIKFYVPGDSRITVGDVAQFNILDGSAASDLVNKKLDPFYSGKYLITAVHHMIQPSSYTTVVEIAKDSVTTEYNPMNKTDPSVQGVVQGLLKNG
jgi:hypothetical protein